MPWSLSGASFYCATCTIKGAKVYILPLSCCLCLNLETGNLNK